MLPIRDIVGRRLPLSAAGSRLRHRGAIALAAFIFGASLVALGTPGQAAATTPYDQNHFVKHVLDGDTIEVYRSGQSGPTDLVRFAAINTNETPEMCHANTAKTFLANLVEGDWVRLTADDATSKAKDGVRWLRFVEHDGVDITKLMIEESYAIAKPITTEPSHNAEYQAAAFEASLQGQRIWDDDYCGVGPQQNAQLRMVVHSNAEGPDDDNLNGEWVRIYNDGDSSVALNGWRLRNTSTFEIWQFPSYANIPANGSIMVHVGSGTDTATKLYMGFDHAIYGIVGDAAYLIDPDWDIRAYFTYPCVVACSDPLQGRIDMTVNADAVGHEDTNPNGEWINITNRSAESFNLHGYLIRNAAKDYEFPTNSRIDPGERLRLYVGPGNDSRLTKHWGRSEGILGNDTDEVEIVTFDEIVVAAFSWPCDPCGPTPPLTIYDYEANPPGPDTPEDEWIEIRNSGSVPVDMRDWQLADNVNRLDFRTSRVLDPGEILRVVVGSGTDTTSTVYWGLSEQILFSNDLIELRTPHRDLVSCVAWGDKVCPPTVEPEMCAGLQPTIVGSPADETILGTAGNDVIVGLGGDDTIDGQGGDDTICGGGGNDILVGGPGNDKLLGGPGDDTLEGRGGNDVLKGKDGADTVRFQTAANSVTVDLRDGFATGEGNDTISSAENIVGSPYRDKLRGDGSANVILGGGGADKIKGRAGRDTLNGEGGKDNINGGGHADAINGGSGADRLEGGRGTDTIVGGGSSDLLLGRSGDDLLFGKGGDDTLQGGSGTDALNGGSGDDSCIGESRINCEA